MITQDCKISIHTPTKGVTSHGIVHKAMREDFNPHSHEGSDIYPYIKSLGRTNFNPHSHEGSDDYMIACLEMAKEISIHTPTKGVTFSSVFKNLITFISIHTPTKGVTVALSRNVQLEIIFQSTLPRRE